MISAFRGFTQTPATISATGKSSALAVISTQAVMVSPGQSATPAGGASQLGSRVLATTTALKRSWQAASVLKPMGPPQS